MNYQEFRKQYEERHPSSVPKLEFDVNEYPRWVRYAVSLTFICAAMVSGIHTVPTIWESIIPNAIVNENMRMIVSYASIFAVELAILLSAYLMAKGVKLAYLVMLTASTVAISANLYSVTKAFGTGTSQGALIVAFVLGIGAPMIALFAGKMFVDIHKANRIQDARARKAFKDASIAWDKIIDKAWKAELRTGAKDNNKVSTIVHSDNTDGRTSGHGFTRRTDAKDIVRDYLEKNPQDNERSVRELAILLGVGKSTVADAKRNFSTNGHTNGHS